MCNNNDTATMRVAERLPSIFSSAIGTIKWPLDGVNSPPLYYESVEKLKLIRRDEDKLGDNPLFKDPQSVLTDMFPRAKAGSTAKDVDEQYFGVISAGLILLGNGLTDEAHNIALPMSWPGDIDFATQPSVYNEVSPAVKSYSTYLHTLVHRREAYNKGELGMIGWDNANFWANQFEESPGVSDLPHRDLLDRVSALVAEYGKNNSTVQKWTSKHSFTSFTKSHFEPKTVHKLCAAVLNDTKKGKCSDLQEFAEQVAESEVRIVLYHALQRAGFECSMDDIITPLKAET